MKEAKFLKENAKKWESFEKNFDAKDGSMPDVLADQFVEITDDLSYAKTHYPKSKTISYLNGIAMMVHQSIYKNKRENSNRFIEFWKHELPLLIGRNHKYLLYSFLTFAISIAIGVISTQNDDSFVRLILGDTYVNMTLENIENDDPMAVYKQMGELDMALALTFNNIRVSFLAFLAGLFFSIGTLYILFSNGVMVGAFFTFLFQQGHTVFEESLLTVFIHGTLELSVIVIAGAAGIILGNSFLFPGTHSRLKSFLTGTKKGIKIIIGIFPLFMAAGFLEGFITRHTNMPNWLSLTIIFGSLIFVIWYFVIYPIQLFRRDKKLNNLNTENILINAYKS